ncbi:hypothetical protein [Oceanobacillus indicireducens]|uniref:Uncharacterized protein n=1 Tax=Oceanobacillus indicireducens TaxID=1004261 RepID=A0A917XQD8_9BACI|nr:hypothetical protein [Oceanobacillus indicireducens]GGN49041.1 hypothetical protein GCM10007971_01330 [Oceanobacillus indicireducens]
MKKRNIITAVGAGVIGAGAASYFLLNDSQKSKIKESVNNLLNNQMNPSESTFEKAGHPDQMDMRDNADLENAKMVSEGSQFGVQYYNEKNEKQENTQLQ